MSGAVEIRPDGGKSRPRPDPAYQTFVSTILDPQFVAPQYHSYNFANLPQAIYHLLTGQGISVLPDDVFADLPRRYRTVILFWIDAFGWAFFERYADRFPLLRDGVASKITSQFPSTTAAHATCLHGGQPVGQSGIFEWQYYEPKLDALITPLLFSFAEGNLDRDTLKPTGIDPRSIYPTHTFYQTLRKAGVSAYVLQYESYARSTFSDIILAGAQVIPYNTVSNALTAIRALLQQPAAEPRYIVFYYGGVDKVCHDHGPNAPEFETEVTGLLQTLEREFYRPLKGELKETLFLLTADHGQVAVEPETTIYLDLDPAFRGVERFIKTNRRGELLVPGGSARDLFLYLKDEALTEAQQFLAERLAGQAVVYRVSDLITAGFFGPPPPSTDFLARVGDLVVLPYANKMVYWFGGGRFKQKFYGHHGGLTPEEMEIPLILFDLG